MTPIVLLVFTMALVVGAVVFVRVLRADGYGHNPPPRSHRGEEVLTQHEQLRRLVR